MNLRFRKARVKPFLHQGDGRGLTFGVVVPIIGGLAETNHTDEAIGGVKAA